MSANARLAQAEHQAQRVVDVVVRLGPADVAPVEVEVILEEDLVDERRELGPRRDGLDDGELDRGRVDVDLDDDKVLLRDGRLEELDERVGPRRVDAADRLAPVRAWL